MRNWESSTIKTEIYRNKCNPRLCSGILAIVNAICVSLLLVSYGLADSQNLSNPGISDKKTDMPQACRADCVHEYGFELGSSPAGIPAFSNCNSKCVIFEPNHLQSIYTGIKWQCVEYARRWLLHEYGLVFGDVDIAADIWDLQFVFNPLNDKKFALQTIVNGSNALPQRGDLLIYVEEYLQTGHVAVIVNVDEERQVVQVAEQNFLNEKWDANFAREISYSKIKDRYWLLDAYLIGTKRVMREQVARVKNLH